MRERPVSTRRAPLDERVALPRARINSFCSKKVPRGAVSAGTPFSPPNQRLSADGRALAPTGERKDVVFGQRGCIQETIELIPQSSGYAAFPQPLIHNFRLYLSFVSKDTLANINDLTGVYLMD